MAESSVQSAVQWLGNLLLEEENIGPIKHKVEELREELDWLQCFLREADASRYTDPRISRWVTQIQQIAYEAEDIVGIFLVKFICRQNQQHIGKASAIKNRFERYLWVVKEANVIRDASYDIEALRIKISNLTSRLQAYGIKITRSVSGSSVYTQLVNVIKDEIFIGLDNQVKPIVSELVSESGEKRVIGLWGKGGVGKTTLVRKVYLNHTVRRHFDRFAWVHVSQNCKISGLHRDLLCSLATRSWDEIGLMTDQELNKELYDVLLEKKCLVVLDDIWSREIWNGLKSAFPGNEDKESGSKFLFTTNSRQVAEQIYECTSTSVHEMRSLTYDESWELLQTKLGGFPAHTFGTEGAHKMMELAKKMLRSCHGIPLAIIAFGGLLATKKTPEEWQTLLDHINSDQNLKHHEQRYEKVLELCYYGLPYYLKNCFLYLGSFPENFEIPIKRLCHMWLAEGIVILENGQVSSGGSLEDFAEHCLGELLQRGVVQVAERGSTGRIKSCRLHNIMRDLCLKVSKEENFLSIVDQESNVLNGKTRRVSVYSGGEDEEVSLPRKNPFIRSLLLFPSRKERQEVNYKSITALCKDFQLLRVLDLEGLAVSSKTLPTEIVELIYLRYLSLRNMPLTKLPSAIGSLRWLETLDLRVNTRLELPNVLRRLERLKNLYLPSYFTIKDGDKLRLDNLKFLVTLKNVNLFLVADVLAMKFLRKASLSYMPDNEHLEFIQKSPRIVFSLTIFRAVICEEQVNVLKSFHNLIKLELKGGVSVPINNLQFPPYLKKLLLDFCGFLQDPMPVLEKLPSLKSLCLDHQAYMGKSMACTALGFPQLTYLRLNGLKNLEECKMEQGAMPNLIHLEVKGCERLTRLPEGLPQQVQITHI